MPLITEHNQVLDIYAATAARQWVVPTFCSENLTTTEAVLAAVREYGGAHGIKDLPVTLAITNLYAHRAQTLNYTRTGSWRTGLKLFMADLRALCEPDSPFAGLRVMAHLDHIQPDADAELLEGDLSGFSSVMFDASAMPLAQNMECTARFVEERGNEIVIEGACDEIVDAGGGAADSLTSPARAREYLQRTGVDFMVANLGTEHRAGTADLIYRADLAHAVSAHAAPCLVLHGCSSISDDQMQTLFADGIRKVNIWTALERDSAPALLEAMAVHASRICGTSNARRLHARGLLGDNAELQSKPDLTFFSTAWRQDVVFRQMKRIVKKFLSLLMPLQ